MEITFKGKPEKVLKEMQDFIAKMEPTQANHPESESETLLFELFAPEEGSLIKLTQAKSHVEDNNYNWSEYRSKSGLDKYFYRTSKARYYKGLKIKA